MSTVDPIVWPEGRRRFALFAECAIVGVYVVVGAVAIVTAPAALAAGASYLRRYLQARKAGFPLFWSLYWEALRRSWWMGLGLVAAAIVVFIDIRLAFTGALPGGSIIALAVGFLALVAVSLLVRASAVWRPGGSYRDAVRFAARTAISDVTGSIWLVTAVAMVAVVSWQLPPLIILGAGCLMLAMVAIDQRTNATAG